MPPLPGEATLLTVHADVLYTFSPPGYKPAHYRFEKDTYLYLYQKSPEGSGRLEVVNNSGQADQDSVAGQLEGAQIDHSYNKSTAITLRPSGSQPWKLPTFDPRGERKYMYPIQSVDVYFWSPEEAIQCLQSLRSIHGIDNFNVEDLPNVGHNGATQMSPVIERLEKAAISVHSQQRQDSSSSLPSTQRDTVSTHSHLSTPTTVAREPTAAFAPIPYNPAAPAAPETRVTREKTPPPLEGESVPGHPGSQSYFPQQNPYGQQMPPPPPSQRPNGYVPQQPHSRISPPTLAHRTSSFLPPPPQQGAVSPGPASGFHTAVQTPLPFSPPPAQASFNQPQAFHQYPSQGSSYVGGYQPQQQFHPTQASHPAGFASPPQSPGFLPPPPQSPPFQPPQPQSPGFQPPTSQAYPGYGVQTPDHQPAHHSPSPATGQQFQGYPPPPGTANTPPITLQQAYQAPQSSFSNSPAQTQQIPTGVYSSYSYGQQPGSQQQGKLSDAYAVHSQMYQPTEAESAHGRPSGQQPTGGWASRADKAEKSVGRFLKKLDKKF